MKLQDIQRRLGVDTATAMRIQSAHSPFGSTDMTNEINPGDWVMFALDGRPVVGVVVKVVPRASWERADSVMTTAGLVRADYIREVRRG